MSRSADPILDAALSLSALGVGVHWLWGKSKKPIDDGWSTAPVATPESLSRTYRIGYNVGVRPGEFSDAGGAFLHVLDLDVRDEAKASEPYAWLDQHWPEWRKFPTVQSGSGGSSRHVYFFLDKPYRSRMCARSTEHCMYRDRKVWAWQIEVYGSGKQIAAPPSIHPDTGLPYKWLTPLDLDAIDLGCTPMVDAKLIQSWGSHIPSNVQSDLTFEEKPKLGLTIDEAREIVFKLPLEDFCEDRQGWFTTGMAIRHEFGDTEEAYDLWADFSMQSDKFNEDEQRKVWNSFRGSANPIRMATLKAEARKVEIAEMFEELGDDEGDAENDIFPENYTEKRINSPALIARTTINAARSLLVPDPNWSQKLDLNEESHIKATLHNLTLIIRNDPRTRSLAALNEFTQEVVQRGQPGRFKMKRKVRRARSSSTAPSGTSETP
jgi:hypothetical protein